MDAPFSKPVVASYPGAKISLGTSGGLLNWVLGQLKLELPPMLIYSIAGISVALFVWGVIDYLRKYRDWLKTHRAEPDSMVGKLANRVAANLNGIIYSIMGIAGVALVGAALLGWMFSTSKPAGGTVADHSSTIATRSQPNYVGNVRFIGAIGENGIGLVEFKANDYFDRLRVYIEFTSAATSGVDSALWTGPKGKIQIADLTDITKGQVKSIPLLSIYRQPNQNLVFRWGDPKTEPESNSYFTHAKNKARVYFVGPDKQEQEFKILAVKSNHDVQMVTMTGAPTVIFFDEKELATALEWPEDR
jgi:hypothetical protein